MAANYPKDLARHVYRHLISRRKERPPQLTVLETLFESLYFASLKQEENQPISCRIAFIRRADPDPFPPSRIVADRWSVFRIEPQLPFSVRNLVKLSTAVDPWTSTLAVDVDITGELRIWGLIDQSLHYSAYVMKETSTGPEMPGMFQATIEGVGEIAAYKTYVLLGSLRKDVLVTKQPRVFEAGPFHSKLRKIIRKYRRAVVAKVEKDAYRARRHWDESLEDLWISTLCRILIGIRRYGHGGAVLISDTDRGLSPKYTLGYPRLRDALVRAGAETISHTYYSDIIHEEFIDGKLEEMPLDLYLDEAVSSSELEDINNELRGCIRFMVSLSRVDGLVWVDSDLSLHGFGVEITTKKDPRAVYRAHNTMGTNLTRLDLNHFGMRHRSMMRYCEALPSSIGFVISQDGDVRAIANIDGRILLWDDVRIQSILIPRTPRALLS